MMLHIVVHSSIVVSNHIHSSFRSHRFVPIVSFQQVVPAFGSNKNEKRKMKSTRERKEKENSISRDHQLISHHLIPHEAAVSAKPLLSLFPLPHHTPSTPSPITSSPSPLCATALLKALTTSSGTVSQSKLLVYTSAALCPLASLILPSVSARLGR
jgi:hypothetical protein